MVCNQGAVTGRMCGVGKGTGWKDGRMDQGQETGWAVMEINDQFQQKTTFGQPNAQDRPDLNSFNTALMGMAPKKGSVWEDQTDLSGVGATSSGFVEGKLKKTVQSGCFHDSRKRDATTKGMLIVHTSLISPKSGEIRSFAKKVTGFAYQC